MIDGGDAEVFPVAKSSPEPPTTLLRAPTRPSTYAVEDPADVTIVAPPPFAGPAAPPEARPEPVAEAEPVPVPVAEAEPVPEPVAGTEAEPEPAAEQEPAAAPARAQVIEPSEPTVALSERPGPVWPGLSAAGLPTRVPRRGDEEELKEAFFHSWEAAPTSPTPLTRQPFTPTYLGEPPRPRLTSEDLPSAASEPAEPPEPKKPPQPAEPPEPKEPPQPKEPPTPAPPSPPPFPAPVPVPPSPVPSPLPPSPVPVPPVPVPPVPTPPSPFPPPPGPVPPPPSITRPTVPGLPRTDPATRGSTPPKPVVVPGRPTATRYQGGQYSELATEPITTTGVVATRDMTGSRTVRLLSEETLQRRERRRRYRAVAWVAAILLLFAGTIALFVILLAGDFLNGLFDTFSRWAG